MDLGIHQVAVHTVHRAQGEFRFFDFFSGNCEMRWTFPTGTEVVSKLRMWKILVSLKVRSEKKSIFVIISKMVWNFGVASVPVYAVRGLYITAAKSLEFP